MPFKLPHSLPDSLRSAPLSALLCLLVAALTQPAQARGPDFRGHRAAFRAQADARPRSLERVPRQSPARSLQPRDVPPIDRPQQRQLATPNQSEGPARPSVPQPSIAQPSIAQPSVPQPSVPQPSVPQPSVLPPAEPPPTDGTRPGRLTPDERRALRQQINEAGRDIYRPGRP